MKKLWINKSENTIIWGEFVPTDRSWSLQDGAQLVACNVSISDHPHFWSHYWIGIDQSRKFDLHQLKKTIPRSDLPLYINWSHKTLLFEQLLKGEIPQSNKKEV